MELTNLLDVKNRDELRVWLTHNYNKEKSCWIDSTTKKISDTVTVQRLSPRAKNSPWTELNKERVRRMEKLQKMTDAGRAVLPDMSKEGFVVDNTRQNIMYGEWNDNGRL
ncbi:MAG: YdeI family protein [Cellulosilyticaceae bacterium]